MAAAALADKPPAKPVEPEFIEFECDYCSEPVKMPMAEGGRRVSCPSCRRIIKVPEPKKEKKDWRDTSTGLPSGARLPDTPIPEGTWDAGQKARVSEETLEEVGAIPPPPRTVPQRISRGFFWVCVLGLLTWGSFAGYRWWQGWGEANALQEALSYGESKEGNQLSRDQAGALHVVALDYYRRSGKADSAVKAQQQFDKAYSQLTASADSLERDLVLMELALAEIDLGDKGEDVDKGTRLPWEKVHKRASTALKDINDREARLEGLRQTARRLLARKESNRILALTTQIFTTPAEKAYALAEMGLEFAGVGDKENAGKACKEALQFYANEKEAPPLSPSVIALARLLKEKLPKVPKMEKDEADSDAMRLGEMEAKARTDKDKRAQARIEADKNFFIPEVRLQAWVRLAASGVAGSPSDPADLEKAIDRAAELKGKGEVSWQVYRLVDLGILAGLAEDKLQRLADGIGNAAIRGQAQLNVFRLRLAHAREALKEGDANQVDQATVSHMLARLYLSEHNTRQDGSWVKVVQAWPQPVKAFGLLGVALGLQARQ